MARSLGTSVRVLLAGCVLLLSLASRAAEPSPWLEIHSTHFTVITDAGDKKGKEVALRFEQMRAVFAVLLMKERLHEPLPLTIIAFKNDKDYYQTAAAAPRSAYARSRLFPARRRPELHRAEPGRGGILARRRPRLRPPASQLQLSRSPGMVRRRPRRILRFHPRRRQKVRNRWRP